MQTLAQQPVWTPAHTFSTILSILILLVPIVLAWHLRAERERRNANKRFDDAERKAFENEERLIRIKQETQAREAGRLAARREFYEQNRTRR